MVGVGSVRTVALVTVGAGASTGWLSFFDLFLFGRVAHSVRLSPALGFVALFGLDEAVVGVAAGGSGVVQVEDRITIFIK